MLGGGDGKTETLERAVDCRRWRRVGREPQRTIVGDDDILVLPAWYRLLWRRDTLRKGSGSSQAAEHQRQRQAPGTHEVRPMPHMHLSYERGKPATSG